MKVSSPTRQPSSFLPTVAASASPTDSAIFDCRGECMTLTQSAATTSIPSPPHHAASIGERVEAHLTELFDRESRRWNDVDPEFAAPLTSLRRFVTQGGKRLRPAFCHWGFVAAGAMSTTPSNGAGWSRSARPSSCCTRSPSSNADIPTEARGALVDLAHFIRDREH